MTWQATHEFMAVYHKDVALGIACTYIAILTFMLARNMRQLNDARATLQQQAANGLTVFTHEAYEREIDRLHTKVMHIGIEAMQSQVHLQHQHRVLELALTRGLYKHDGRFRRIERAELFVERAAADAEPAKTEKEQKHG